MGPRQSGKSTLIESRYTKSVWKINLLLNDVFFPYSKDPALFRRQAEEKILHEGIKIIFIDEIQRLPLLLNEIQFLMGEFKECQFILTGSSARKLKRGGANLLAGRAVERRLFPLVFQEMKPSKLEDVLRFGSLPALCGKNDKEKTDILSTYAHVYLREEIQSEGIVRNLGAFSKFLDMSAGQCAELVSFSSVARECHLPVRTVQSYYQILEDTLIGFRLEPWHKSVRKRLVSHPKFYFFDTGITNAINKRLTGSLDRERLGRLFEQFIVLETYRMAHYLRSEVNIYFWRTNHGAEVDLIMEKHGKIKHAFEIKFSDNISGAHLSGLRAFREEHPQVPCSVICTAPHAYELDRVKILPWNKYLEKISNVLAIGNFLVEK
ncbi:MAG: ATP-binding protein [Candidatus Omnitrophica bacterium]|nr:ATP-binding protein [Candidatus Omnitrophota bacterium]